LENHIMIYWLVAGVAFFIAEMAIPGIGLLFAGFGALSVGMLLNFSLLSVDGNLQQMLAFVVFTILWTLILWKPMQKFRIGKNKTPYHNIIGETAIVGEKGLHRINGGEVVWSGANMKAKLDERASIEQLDAGKQVVIKEITGNTLIVTPK